MEYHTKTEEGLSTAEALATIDRVTKHNGRSQRTAPAARDVHIAIDPKKVELWEIEVFESGNMGNGMLVLARYLVDNNGQLVSPGLPDAPVDELPKGEVARIRNSAAYRLLRRFNVSQLESAMSQIKDGSGF